MNNLREMLRRGSGAHGEIYGDGGSEEDDSIYTQEIIARRPSILKVKQGSPDWWSILGSQKSNSESWI